MILEWLLEPQQLEVAGPRRSLAQLEVSGRFELGFFWSNLAHVLGWAEVEVCDQ